MEGSVSAMSGVGETQATHVDWKMARPFLRNRLRGMVFRADDATLEDLVQDACVRLHRACRRTQVENLEGFMTTIAKRVALDHVRARSLETALLTPMPEDFEAPAPAGSVPGCHQGDPLDRFRFVVLEFFRLGRSGCHDIALSYFANQDWARVAEKLKRSHAAVRKQWSRCVETLRLEAARDQSPLAAWAGVEFS